MCLYPGQQATSAQRRTKMLAKIAQSKPRCQRGSAKHVPKYAPSLCFKCAHSQPLHLIWTSFALKHSWRYKLPEHMLRFV
eukprot:1144426-Pelagomonas_calceolata.AAC.10